MNFVSLYLYDRKTKAILHEVIHLIYEEFYFSLKVEILEFFADTIPNKITISQIWVQSNRMQIDFKENGIDNIKDR